MSLADVRKKTAEKMGGGQVLQCTVCKAPTPWETLSYLGARCQRCYDAYCREPLAVRNARIKAEQPQRALPRREGMRVQGAQQVGELLATKPSREQVRQYADELGVDVGHEW